MSTRLSHVSQPHDTNHRANPARAAALAALAVVTSLAVGRAFSWWLVPGYLALMGWLVAPSTRRDARPAAPAIPDTDPAPAPNDDSPEPGGTPPVEPPTTEVPARSRKRTRKTKAKVPVEPLEPAVWVRVGPGQFVRAEGATDTPSNREEHTGEPAPEPAGSPALEALRPDPAPRQEHRPRRHAVRIEPAEGFRARTPRHRRSLAPRSLRWKATRLLID